jgi:hypothetical protein
LHLVQDGIDGGSQFGRQFATGQVGERPAIGQGIRAGQVREGLVLVGLAGGDGQVEVGAKLPEGKVAHWGAAGDGALLRLSFFHIFSFHHEPA